MFPATNTAMENFHRVGRQTKMWAINAPRACLLKKTRRPFAQRVVWVRQGHATDNNLKVSLRILLSTALSFDQLDDIGTF
jgi:hypothetical protein